jgi:DNA invertase Pin-like site-specific DNA recombinase
MEDKLRFAPLIRVSTESQERRGHSLEVQTKTLTNAVNSLGGIIPDDCWEYSGQEHATTDHERQKFTKLLYDCQQNKFDAIIVYDPSRWSRDNRKSKEGLEILKQHGIRFFVGTTEYNLFDPQASLFLGMSTEMNEYFALEQSRKSILSRIDRARSNKPSAGKLPFGRTYNRAAGLWGVDEAKRQDIVWAANEYLAGESLEILAKKLGMNHPNLWKVLNHRSGSKWEIKFEDKRLQIDEVVTLTIPALLPDTIIDAIHKKAELNKKYDRKAIKNRYLLSRTIYCAECGLAMHGQANSKSRLYYRHVTADLGWTHPPPGNGPTQLVFQTEAPPI